ncbi:glycosyltransferase family 2 protein [Chitinophaga qingshengii]|uniref:Glycosyltransferase family 2 protein n=1 Tax=Chitinophaga qingshengii TaxID=1569794 RepID=A0ABR7TWQ3_9BACT|nr:glycosyltransferase family A protein [Chitinophaga qingshengii]MBC9933809.1 glycosyltransferase family 2 protein [Chitinophaga qingshengii]
MDTGTATGLTFSIIIPTYNRAEKLRKCLESIVKQTYQNFEVLVCDDGSRDNSKEVVDLFRDSLNIKYFYNDNWGGPAYPRNVGIENAAAPWLCFLDSDDSWYPQKLERVKEQLDAYDLICHDFDVEGKITYRSRLKTRQFGKDVFRTLMTKGNSIVTSSVCVRKEVFREMKGFSLEKELIAVEDFDLWLRMAQKGYRFGVISESMGAYWTGDGNITGVNDKQIARIRAVFGRHMHELPAGSVAYAQSLGFQYYLTGRIKHKMCEFREAIKLYTKAIAKGAPVIKFNACCHLLIAMIRK